MSDRTRRGIARWLRADAFLAVWLYGAACFVASVWLLRDALATRVVRALEYGAGDCVVNWLGARAFERGLDPFSRAGLAWAHIDALGHPPTTLLWYLPFTAFPIVPLNQIVGQLLLFMLLIHCLMLVAELRAPAPIATGLLLFALVMHTTWWPQNVANLQLSEPIALWYVVAWILLRRDHPLAAGIAVGLAMTMKPYAGLLLVLFIVARRWSALAGALATWALAAAIVTVRFGVQCWGEFLVMAARTQASWTADLRNASVQGIVARWWRPGGGPGPLTWKATALALLIDLLVVGWLVWAVRRALQRPRPAPVAADIDVPFALFVIASAWLNPVVWQHYLVTLLQPIAIAVAAMVPLVKQGRLRQWLPPALAILVAIVPIFVLDLTVIDPPHHHFYELARWLPWPLVLLACGSLLRVPPTAESEAASRR